MIMFIWLCLYDFVYMIVYVYERYQIYAGLPRFCTASCSSPGAQRGQLYVQLKSWHVEGLVFRCCLQILDFLDWLEIARYLDLLDHAQSFYLVFFKLTWALVVFLVTVSFSVCLSACYLRYIATSIVVLALFYNYDSTYARRQLPGEHEKRPDMCAKRMCKCQATSNGRNCTQYISWWRCKQRVCKCVPLLMWNLIWMMLAKNCNKEQHPIPKWRTRSSTLLSWLKSIQIDKSIVEGSLEVKLPTIWTDGKAEVRRVREEKGRRQKVQAREKVEKSRNKLFHYFVAPEGRKVGPPAGAEPSGRMRDQKLHAAVARSTCWSQNNVKDTSGSEHLWTLSSWKSTCRCGANRIFDFEVKIYKAPQLRRTFGRWAVEKAHAAVACSIFRSDNVKNIARLEHFWKLSCSKSAHGCGAKHIWKWKCPKQHSVGALLDTVGSCDVEKVHAAVARHVCNSNV